ncbi:polysaccharide lyase family 8 super-sandwich domain-containing protein [Thaumasiovibrio subtropicus]|uniref:polysaccharide lyase family 8 super-sandwich domain-containing protein n=1 Tax=Thaumasiovibrio subtropicus TaxID=1891207 RepID=UPI000B354174|nr:polysaccharide lyase family 8 super-sandwich domain-containing protein [Thaumasiovibrio subtropicus]
MKILRYSLLATSIALTFGCSIEGKADTTPAPNANPPVTAPDVHPGDHFVVLQERLLPDLIEREVSNSKKKGLSLQAYADQHLATLAADGSWPDLDYTSQSPTNWPPAKHLARMRVIAAAYQDSQSAIYLDATINALNHWYSVKPTAHWWWEDIGKPQALGRVSVLLGDALPDNLRQEAVAILPTKVAFAPNLPQLKITGANRTDIALAVIYHGLLDNKAELVGAGLKDIEATIEVTTGEGIQHDYSYQQHGPQLYVGGYGEVFFSSVVKWADFVNDLQWKFSQEKLDILADFYLEGTRWMTRGKHLDYNVKGRSLTREVKVSEPATTPQLISNNTDMDVIAKLSPSHAAEAMAFKAHVHGGPSGINGFKHYWRSDYSVKAADGHFFGIKMNSQRTKPTESGNGENLLGYWLGFGSTTLMQRGDEYLNIFPVWDWKLIPGVTAPEFEGLPADWGRIEQRGVSFVGGASNGRYGVTTMDMNLDTAPEQGNPFNTQAKKSWFSFKDEVVALGAGISSTHEANVNTTINQTLLNGTVTVDGNGLAKGDHDINSASWVHHDNVGYVFPNNGARFVSNKTQSGTWKRINNGQSDALVEKDVFTLRIPHGTQPNNGEYEYIIAFEQSADDTLAYAQALPVDVLSNTAEIQAVRHNGLGITSIVFHTAGDLALNNDLTLSVDEPSVVMLEGSLDNPMITLSTPGKRYAEVNVTLSSSMAHTRSTAYVVTPGKESQTGNSVRFAFFKGQNNPELLQELAEYKLLPKEIKVFQDSHVINGGNANKNFGNSSYMPIRNGGAGFWRMGVVSLDISALEGKAVNSASLKVFARNIDTKTRPSGDLTATLAQPGNWDERSITFNNMPAFEGQPSATPISVTAEGKEQWHSLDITEIVNANLDQQRLDFVLHLPDQSDRVSYVSLATNQYQGGKYAPRMEYTLK